MANQIILAVDDSGKFLEYIPKEVGHKGKGKRHLAIAVLLINSQDQVLLQKRKHKIFDNIWDLTGATHPLHKLHNCHSEERSDVGILIKNKPLDYFPSEKKDCHALRARNDKQCKLCNTDNVDETLEEATWRCLKEEFGISGKMPLKNLGFFNYFAQYGDFCENEHCVMMTGEYNGAVNLNPEAGYEYKWMGKDKFLKDLHSNPQNYTPWAKEGVKLLKNLTTKSFRGLM